MIFSWLAPAWALTEDDLPCEVRPETTAQIAAERRDEPPAVNDTDVTHEDADGDVRPCAWGPCTVLVEGAQYYCRHEHHRAWHQQRNQEVA